MYLCCCCCWWWWWWSAVRDTFTKSGRELMIWDISSCQSNYHHLITDNSGLTRMSYDIINCQSVTALNNQLSVSLIQQQTSQDNCCSRCVSHMTQTTHDDRLSITRMDTCNTLQSIVTRVAQWRSATALDLRSVSSVFNSHQDKAA